MADDAEQEYVVEDAGKKTQADYEKDLAERERKAQEGLNMSKAAGVLGEILDDPPIFCKDQKIKDRTAECVLRVLVAIKEAQVEAVVNGLTPDQIDTLMKYIYKLLGSGENSNALLKWHECTFKKGGLGSIVRAISERRNVY